MNGHALHYTSFFNRHVSFRLCVGKDDTGANVCVLSYLSFAASNDRKECFITSMNPLEMRQRDDSGEVRHGPQLFRRFSVDGVYF